MHGKLKDKPGLFESLMTSGGGGPGEGGPGSGEAPGYLLLENGDFFNLEGGSDKLAISGLVAVQPDNISQIATAALADIVLMTNDPSGVPESQGATLTRILNSIALLSDAGVLSPSDVIPVYHSGAVTKATLQKLLNASNLLADATLPLTGDEYLLLHQDLATDAEKILLHDITIAGSFVGQNVTDGWTIKGSVVGTDSLASSAIADALTSVVIGAGSTTARTSTSATMPPFRRQTSGSTSGNYGGLDGVAQYTLARQTRFMCLCALPSVANVRFFVGLFEDGTATISGADGVGGTTDWCGFRFSTGASDPAFMYSSGTGGSGSFVTTGVNADTSLHLFEFRVKASGLVDFYVDRVRIAQDVAITTSTSALLRFVVCVATLTGANKNVDYCTHRVWQRP